MKEGIKVRDYVRIRIQELHKFVDEWESKRKMDPVNYPELLNLAEWTEQETVFGELNSSTES